PRPHDFRSELPLRGSSGLPPEFPFQDQISRSHLTRYEGTVRVSRKSRQRIDSKIFFRRNLLPWEPRISVSFRNARPIFVCTRRQKRSAHRCAPAPRLLLSTSEPKEPFMPRPLWSGSISFGLVTIPVSLMSAKE